MKKIDNKYLMFGAFAVIVVLGMLFGNSADAWTRAQLEAAAGDMEAGMSFLESAQAENVWDHPVDAVHPDGHHRPVWDLDYIETLPECGGLDVDAAGNCK